MELNIILEVMTWPLVFWIGWTGVLLPLYLTAKWVLD